MRLAFASLLILVAAAGTAHADGYYFTEQLGGAVISDQAAARLGDGGGLSARVSLGMRRGNVAVEAWFGAVTAFTDASRPTSQPGREVDPQGGDALLMYGVDVKLVRPIAGPLEVYLKGGISHGEARRALDGYGGRGFGVGAGIQLKGKVPVLGFLAWPLFFLTKGPKVTGALYIENGVDFFRLHRGGDIGDPNAVDAKVSRLVAGFAVGSDF